MNIQFSS